MDFIQAQNRTQLFFSCLEDLVGVDNPVRLIDAFTDKLDLPGLVEVSLIMTVYNFKRVMNLFSFDKFLEKLKKWTPDYEKIIRTFLQNDFISSKLRTLFFHQTNFSLKVRVE